MVRGWMELSPRSIVARKGESIAYNRDWIPALAGMTARPGSSFMGEGVCPI